MKNTFFSSLFKPNNRLKKDESKVFETLHSIQKESKLTLYFDVEIFHHKQSYKIPLLIYDKFRGLYIFEIKEWDYEELKNATITPSTKQKPAQNTLAYENMQTFIQQKFNEIIHTDGVELFNYLLLPNLTTNEYLQLSDTIKSSLLQNKILFTDETKQNILTKLELPEKKDNSLGSKDFILGTLLSQYCILDKKNELHLLNHEQQAFIDSELTNITYLYGEAKSGKSSLLVLKAFYELLKNPQQKIIILKPTNLSRDILHRQLVETVEHAIVEIDLLNIQVMTPQKFFQSSHNHKYILLCDDFGLYPDITQETLLQNDKNSKKVFVNAATVNQTVSFGLLQNYQNYKRTLKLYQTQPYAKALNILQSLLKKSAANDIIIVSNNDLKQKLFEDLESFVKEMVCLIDSDKNLAAQDLSGLKLAEPKDINALDCEHMIILYHPSFNDTELECAMNLANKSVHLLFEEENSQIQKLKEKYESK
jgi:hypothetical protein